MEPTLETMFEDPLPPNTSGMSLDEIIREFIRLDTQIKEFAYQRREYASVLAERAIGDRNGRNTVSLQASDGAELKVEFGSEWLCDSTEVEVAKELLNEEEFGKLFQTKYTPRVRPLRTFLATVFNDEKKETAKQIIKEHCREVEKSPYVSTKTSSHKSR